MVKRNRRLFLAALISVFSIVLYSVFIEETFFIEDETNIPKISERRAAEIVANFLAESQSMDVSADDLTVTWFVNTEAERFLDEHALTEAYKKKQGAPPLAMWQVSSVVTSSFYFVNPMNGAIIGFLDTEYVDKTNDTEATDGLSVAKTWLKQKGWEQKFTHVKDVTTDDDIVMHQFVSKEPLIGNARLLLKVYTHDGAFAGYYPKLDVPNEYKTPAFTDKLRHILTFVFSIGFMGAIFIFSLVSIVKRATDKGLTVTFPLFAGLMTAVAGILLLYNGLGVIDAGISGLLVFMAMMAVYSKRDQLWNRSPERLFAIKEKVIQGYLLSAVSLLISTVFYAVAERIWKMWGSSEDTFLLLKDAKWLALTPLLVGFYAAVTEEVMYRKFGEFLFKRVWNNQLFIALTTSFIWAIGHLTYNMYPWYFRIIELTFVIGPFFYWVYKAYGLTASIVCHYLFNCFSVSLSLFVLDEYYAYTLLLLLVPLIVFAIPSSQTSPYPTESAA